MGDTYPILEMDFLEFIQARIETMQQNGLWQSVQNKLQQDAVRYRDRPKPVLGITRALENKSWTWNPSLLLDHDIKTPDGKLIAAQGTIVNPLRVISLSKVLIFYDADDQDQRRWALQQDKHYKGNVKYILINGSVLGEEKRLNKPIYFDQAGQLTSRFGITHVPATVMQEGMVLKIAEVAI
jgi:conjugal transfer pilus assembly protein TraW